MTRQVTINSLNEINIPWQPGKARDEALRLVEKARMSGLPFTYSVEVDEPQSAASIELDL